ncbi:MAG: hypothetical protein ACREHV_08545 [Rhizomicrobium sp.]
MRKTSHLRLLACEDAWLCAQGWDTVQEAFALKPRLEWIVTLTTAKQRAAEVQDDLEGIVPVQCGPEMLDCHATGAKGGFSFQLTCPDFIIMVGSPKRDWTISVRYLSAGLWAHGIDALRARVFACLADTTDQLTLDCVRVSRADWCFDFYAPSFDNRYTDGDGRPLRALEGLVMHQRMKARIHGSAGMVDDDDYIVRPGFFETVTIGSKSGCQVQFYDKTREIDEMSGKTWLYDVWKAGLGFDPWGDDKPDKVWRLECRFAADFLKERNLRRPFELLKERPKLVAEALMTRRLAIASEDQNRSRWPVHPLWSEAFRCAAVDHLLPVGRKVIGRRSELIDQCLKQLAGLLRNCSVLTVGADDCDTRADLVKRAIDYLESDPHHQKKIDRAMDRYAAVDFAR